MAKDKSTTVGISRGQNVAEIAIDGEVAQTQTRSETTMVNFTAQKQQLISNNA